MTRRLPDLATAKQQARALRRDQARLGVTIGHAQALERVARQHGFHDWNTLRAAIADLPPEGWAPGGRVRGSYLSQPFEATVIAAEALRPGWFRLTLDLDSAVDVVRFDSFSNFRKRLQCEVGPAGTTRERTSDGNPHLKLEM